MCVCGYICAWERRGPLRSIGSSEAGITGSFKTPSMVQQTEPRSSARTAPALNCWAVFPSALCDLMSYSVTVTVFPGATLNSPIPDCWNPLFSIWPVPQKWGQVLSQFSACLGRRALGKLWSKSSLLMVSLMMLSSSLSPSSWYGLSVQSPSWLAKTVSAILFCTTDTYYL